MIKNILILGAGRSADYLISYLAKWSSESDVRITLADADLHLAIEKADGFSSVTPVRVQVEDEQSVTELVKSHSLVISLLPAYLHMEIARRCLIYRKHFFTASYVSREMNEMEHDIKEKGLLFMNECGLDPGIDHMSAMKIIHSLQREGCRIRSFKSWCGGLIAKESCDNPWGYKFSWNPRNVVLAGKGTAIYRMNGSIRYAPYPRLFRDSFRVQFPRAEFFDGYPNRDSLMYEKLYGLQGASTLLRGTLRYPEFCKAWYILADIGLTDEYASLTEQADLHTLACRCLGISNGDDLKSVLKKIYAGVWNEDVEKKLEYLGLFRSERLPRPAHSLADALQAVLEEKWKLMPQDKDRVVMAHQIEYIHKDGKISSFFSFLDVTGESGKKTAMAKTVGLPLAIAVKLFVTGKVRASGIEIPVEKKWYEPILKELEQHGIAFNEVSYISS